MLSGYGVEMPMFAWQYHSDDCHKGISLLTTYDIYRLWIIDEAIISVYTDVVKLQMWRASKVDNTTVHGCTYIVVDNAEITVGLCFGNIGDSRKDCISIYRGSDWNPHHTGEMHITHVKSTPYRWNTHHTGGVADRIPLVTNVRLGLQRQRNWYWRIRFDTIHPSNHTCYLYQYINMDYIIRCEEFNMKTKHEGT